MKIILILISMALTLTACEENKEISRLKGNIQKENEIARQMPVITPVEITLGEAVTDIIDDGINRVNNITLACSSISGMQIEAGEEFSFNSVTGERSRARGYKDAPIIYKGEKSYGTGGGICQVSSTVYMAALNAGLEITERHQHSESVSYAPDHTDATVVFGEKDLKFKNNTADTIYIYTWIQDGKVYSKIIRKGLELQE